jgi:hypothetical protein
MNRSLSAWLTPALLAAVLLTGCGGGSSSNGATASSPSSAGLGSTSSTGSTASSTGSTSPPTASTSPPTNSTGSASTPTTPKLPAASTAVEACRQGVKRLPHLKASTRSKLEDICGKAGSKDPEAKRKAAREACEELVNASLLPAGASKDRALAACRHAGGSKGSGGK